MKVFRNPQANGQLVGVYRGAKLERIVSNAGESCHLHDIGKDVTVSGHVDQYRVRAGCHPLAAQELKALTHTSKTLVAWI